MSNINDPTLPGRLAEMNRVLAETNVRAQADEAARMSERIGVLTLAIATARNSFLDLEERLQPDGGENCGCRRPTYTCRYCTAKEAAEKLQEVLDGK